MDIERLVAQLKRHEGFSKSVYYIAGIAHIGYGLNLRAFDIHESIAELVFPGGVSEDEAESILRFQVAVAVADCGYTVSGWEVLSPLAQEALVNLRFAVGPNGFRSFELMHNALACGNMLWASEEMLDSRWARRVGRRANELAEQLLQ